METVLVDFGQAVQNLGLSNLQIVGGMLLALVAAYAAATFYSGWNL